ncbi:GPW/gp25 family protein [Asticcacaulis solisilvae]|uniref:GPW/gp25 family protein n=1 Tax=Asticcacaulis solisilvae TaxID=1217274 RepID=UPI003FD8D572
MDRNTGKPLDGTTHIAQSIGDILSTPKGSRVMRRDYGSQLHELTDLPINGMTRLLYAAATAGAIDRWENRIQLDRVVVAGDATGQLAATITGRRTDLPNAPAFNQQVSL